MSCLEIPFELQYALYSREVNSPPQSVRRQHITFPLSFSTRLLKFFNIVSASDLEFKNISPQLSTIIINECDYVPFMAV